MENPTWVIALKLAGSLFRIYASVIIAMTTDRMWHRHLIIGSRKIKQAFFQEVIYLEAKQLIIWSILLKLCCYSLLYKIFEADTPRLILLLQKYVYLVRLIAVLHIISFTLSHTAHPIKYMYIGNVRLRVSKSWDLLLQERKFFITRI